MPVDVHAESGSGGGVRAHVADSWLRSAAAGVQVDTVDAPITLPGDALRDHREAHPLARVFPLLDDVLGQAARDCDAVMAGLIRPRLLTGEELPAFGITAPTVGRVG